MVNMKIVELFKQRFLKSDDSKPPINPADTLLTADECIAHGNTLEDQGQLDLAEVSYRQALKLEADNAKVYLNLGNVLLKKELYPQAIEAYESAIALKPDFASAYFNIGNARLKSGSIDVAIESYLLAIQIDGGRAEFHLAIGNSYRLLGKELEAIAHLETCLRLRPGQVPVMLSLGMAYAVVLENLKALDMFRQVLSIDDTIIDAYLLIGTVAQKSGDIEQAVAAFSKVIDFPEAPAHSYFQAGFALYEMRRHERAIEGLKKALAIEKEPNYHNVLGNIYLELTHYSLAIEQYTGVLALDTTLTGTMCNLGTAYVGAGDIEEAIVYLERALELDPDFSMAHNNLAHCYQNTGRPEEAIEQYYKGYKSNPTFDIGYSNYLFCLSHSNLVTPQKLFEEHCRFDTFYGAHGAANGQTFVNSKDPGRVLKIGLISADLRQHAVINFIGPILPFLAARQDVKLYAYDNGKKDDVVSNKVSENFASWKPVRMLNDELLCEKIKADEIDILIDLSGHSALNRLKALTRKPAPLQMSWIGYPGTTGVPEVDYYIGDNIFLPRPDFDQQFVEKIIRLPAMTTFKTEDDAPDINPLPALTNGYVTFGSFNRIDKISEEVVRLWSQVLNSVAGSKILMAAMPATGGTEHLCKWFEKYGIGIERIEFWRRIPPVEYMKLHHKIDFCLDSFPYSGGTTTNNALWMGVPTLTLKGRTAAGRQSTVNLHNVGLDDIFAVDTEEAFVARAVALANDLEQLNQIRQGLRQRFIESRFHDYKTVAETLVAACRHAWQRWCADQPAIAFDVIDNGGEFNIQEWTDAK